MRPLSVRSLSFLIFVFSQTSSFSEVILDGWGKFKFGMSPAQTRTIPGVAVGKYSSTSPAGDDLGVISAKNKVLVLGIPYILTLYFDRRGNSVERPQVILPQTLSKVGFQNEEATSWFRCRNSFSTALTQLEKQNGKFSPVYPERKRNNLDQLPMSIEWKHGDGASRYNLSTVFLPEETAYVWDAQKLFGPRSISVEGIWSAKVIGDQSTCLTEISYQR